MALLAAGTLADWLGDHPGRVATTRACTVALVLVASVAAQVYSLTLLWRAQDFSARLNDRLKTYPEQVVVTNTWFVPQMLHGVFYDKQVFLIPNRAAMARLEERLRARGIDRLLIVETLATRPEPPAILEWEEVRDNRLKMYAVRIVRRPLESPPVAPDGHKHP